jgi:hypothetical protein
VSPNGSSTGRYTEITVRDATANAKQTCCSSSSAYSVRDRLSGEVGITVA